MFNPQATEGIGHSIKAFLTGQEMVHGGKVASKENQDTYSPSEGVEYLTFGPGINELGTNYAYDEGAHNLRMLNLVSPDALLVHQSRVIGFYLKMRNYKQDLLPIDRDIKNSIIKDSRY